MLPSDVRTEKLPQSLEQLAFPVRERDKQKANDRGLFL